MFHNEVPFNPREFIRQFTTGYVNLHALWTKVVKPPESVSLSTPAKTPILAADLPDRARIVLEEFRAQRPRAKITFVKHVRAENGKAVQVTDDDQGLPAEDELLSLSHTVTLNTSDYVRVVTDMYVARVQ